MKRLFAWKHASGRLSRLPPFTLRPTNELLRARGARDEHGATSWSREMDFNTLEHSDVKFLYSKEAHSKSVSRRHDGPRYSSWALRAHNHTLD